MEDRENRPTRTPSPVVILALTLLTAIIIIVIASYSVRQVFPPTPTPTNDVNAIKTAAVATAMEIISSQLTQTALAAPSRTPFPGVTSLYTPVLVTATPFPSAFSQIDQALKESLAGNIAYNSPHTMKLNQTITIELLLNPSIEPTALASQITESGQIFTASIQITPRMKAILKAQEQDAFNIQPLHDNPEQVISGTDTTKWSWFVTAKKAGLQRVTIIIHRLVKFDGQDYWREVETYKADIDVQITFVQRVQALDWKWIAGLAITLLLIPAFWRWMDSRKKKDKKAQRVNFE